MNQCLKIPRGQLLGVKTTWYKSEEAYDLKQTGPAAVPPANLLDVTRKRKAGCQPRPSTSGGPTANKRKADYASSLVTSNST